MLSTICEAKRNNLSYQIAGVEGNFIYAKRDNKTYRLNVVTGVMEPFAMPETGPITHPTSRSNGERCSSLSIKVGDRKVTTTLSEMESEAIRLGILKPEDYFYEVREDKIKRSPMLDSLGGPRFNEFHRFRTNWETGAHQSAVGVDVRPIIIAFFEGVDADKIVKGAKSMYGYSITSLERNYLSGGYTLNFTLEELIEDMNTVIEIA